MSNVAIAGRLVKQGDALYHTGLKSWGQVTGFDIGSAKLRIANGDSERIIYVTDGGMVNGIRQVYWHEPLQLDLPFQNIGKFQRIIEALIREGL